MENPSAGSGRRAAAATFENAATVSPAARRATDRGATLNLGDSRHLTNACLSPPRPRQQRASCKPSPARNAAAAILATLVGRQGQPDEPAQECQRRQVEKERNARVHMRDTTRDASSASTMADALHGAGRKTTNTSSSRGEMNELTCSITSKNGKAHGNAVTRAEKGLSPQRGEGVLDINAGRDEVEGEECPSPLTSASSASPASSASSHPEHDRCDHATPARATRRRAQQHAESTTRDTRSTRCPTLTTLASAGCDSAGSSSSRRRTSRTSPRTRPPKLRDSARGEDGQLGRVGKGVTPPGKSVPGKGYEREVSAESFADDGATAAIGNAHPRSKENLGVAGEAGLMSPSSSSPGGSWGGAGPRDEYSYKFANYCRKDKSLGLLCGRFVEVYARAQHIQSNEVTPKLTKSRSAGRGEESDTFESEGMVELDRAAVELGVARRRIYDVINILESLCIVTRARKNTYRWHGKCNMDITLKQLQRTGALVFPEEVAKNGMTECLRPGSDQSCSPDSEPTLEANGVGPLGGPRTDGQKEKSLGGLCRRFVQLFLVGNDVVSVGEAAIKLSEPEDVESENVVYKTRARRLYDIANALVALGLVEKAADSHKPNFRWIWTPVRTLPALLPTTPTMSCRRGNFDVATASGDKSGVKPRYARSSLRSTRGSPTTYRTGGGASNSPTTMPDIAIRNASGRGGSGSARSCSTITPRRGRENSTSAATSKTKRGNGDTLTDESDDGGRDSQNPAGKRRKGDAGRRTPDLCTRSASVSDGTTPSRSRQVATGTRKRAKSTDETPPPSSSRRHPATRSSASSAAANSPTTASVTPKPSSSGATASATRPTSGAEMSDLTSDQGSPVDPRQVMRDFPESWDASEEEDRQSTDKSNRKRGRAGHSVQWMMGTEGESPAPAYGSSSDGVAPIVTPLPSSSRIHTALSSAALSSSVTPTPTQALTLTPSVAASLTTAGAHVESQPGPASKTSLTIVERPWGSCTKRRKKCSDGALGGHPPLLAVPDRTASPDYRACSAAASQNPRFLMTSGRDEGTNKGKHRLRQSSTAACPEDGDTADALRREQEQDGMERMVVVAGAADVEGDRAHGGPGGQGGEEVSESIVVGASPWNAAVITPRYDGFAKCNNFGPLQKPGPDSPRTMRRKQLEILDTYMEVYTQQWNSWRNGAAPCSGGRLFPTSPFPVPPYPTVSMENRPDLLGSDGSKDGQKAAARHSSLDQTTSQAHSPWGAISAGPGVLESKRSESLNASSTSVRNPLDARPKNMAV